jgi:hypothetical protein
MKKWILIALIIGLIVGYGYSQYLEHRQYSRRMVVEISNPDELILVKDPTSVTGGDYVIVLNASSIVGGTILWADTQPVSWGTMELHFNISGRPQ